MKIIFICMDSYLDILRRHSFKITPKRKAVIGLFIDTDRRFGPLEVHRRLSKKIVTLGLPTVYRILNELHAVGILLRVTTNDRQLYYALNTGKDAHRHHFICRRCKRVEEVEGCRFAETARGIEKKLGCRVEAHLFQLEGVCSRCL